MSNQPLPPYPLETERLYLRPFDDDDLTDLYEYYRQPNVTRYLPWGTKTLLETREALQNKKKRLALDGENAIYNPAVILKETNKLIGDILLFNRSTESRQGELGYVFNPAFHGKGYATEAAVFMLNLGFEIFNFHRIYARCDPRNTSSYKVMERLGMRREALFVHNEIFKGEWGDELIYAILEHEWRAKNPASSLVNNHLNS